MREEPGSPLKPDTCRSHIQRFAYQNFLGDAESCSRARDFVIETCSACSVCPLTMAGCGVLEPPTSTTTFGTGTTGPPCEAICKLGGLDASCGARIHWAASHPPFQGDDDACTKGYNLVSKQCPMCGGCYPDHKGCPRPPTTQQPEDEEHASTSREIKATTSRDLNENTTTSAESYDCHLRLGQAMSQWTSTRKSWCCKHKGIGCHKDNEIRVLINDYDQELLEGTKIARSSWPRRALAGCALIGIATFAAFVVAAYRRTSCTESSGYTDIGEMHAKCLE